MEMFREKLYRAIDQGIAIDRLIYEGHTEFQAVRIFENDMLGRVMTLDDVVQTTEADEFIYHEMMTHPALCSMDAPRQVLIIGGGDGGCLKEALKHPLDRAVMVELDPGVVELSKEHFRSICADAFEDGRTELIIGDGAKFMAETKEKFDAIIVDSTDPIGPGEVLFSEEFYTNCLNALSEQGVLVTQNGVPFLQRPEYEKNRRTFRKLFRYPAFFFAAVPTYYGGLMAFGCASNGTDVRTVPVSIIGERLSARKIQTRYFNPAIHQAAFATPNYLVDEVTE